MKVVKMDAKGYPEDELGVLLEGKENFCMDDTGRSDRSSGWAWYPSASNTMSVEI